jgi:nucleotide-binding universal stress UspA family protein
MYKKILLPTDGSEYADKAAQHAIWIACLSGAEITALNVVETYALMGLPVIETSTLPGSPEEDLLSEGDLRSVREIWKVKAEEALDKISDLVLENKNKSGCKDFKLTLKTEEGHPADVTLKIIEGEDVDLVVMGTAGRHGLDRFLLGSITEKVLRSARCPVLAVH